MQTKAHYVAEIIVLFTMYFFFAFPTLVLEEGSGFQSGFIAGVFFYFILKLSYERVIILKRFDALVQMGNEVNERAKELKKKKEHEKNGDDQE